MGRIGEIEHYGPFLMEVAMQAYLKNDKARAEQYARGAAEDSPVSARANILLARILIEAGNFEEAQSTLAKGLDKAARYKHREEWQELARLNATVARGLKDPSAIKAAQALQDCLKQHLFSVAEFLCE